MTDPITKRTAQLLTTSQNIFIPLTALYEALAAEGLMSWIDLDAFEDFLASDEQFVLLEGLGDLEALAPILNIELDIQDFWDDPLVMLRSRATTPQIVVQGVLEHMHEMNAALETAWQSRPVDDPFVEAELIGMLMMGDMLERELRGALHLYATDEKPEPQGRRDLGDV
jgi:hypothetical protein